MAKKEWLVAALAIGVSSACMAQKSDMWVRAGIASITFDEKAVLSVGGEVVPGAGATVKNNVAAVFDVGGMVTESVSASLTFGIPPETEVKGTGSAAALGLLGKAKYGSAVAGIQYHLGSVIGWKPYVGVGVARLIVTDTDDGSLSGLQLKDKWGSALQVGATYELSPTIQLFVDVKKLWLKSSGKGTVPAFGGAPATASFKLDPTVAHFGVQLGF